MVVVTPTMANTPTTGMMSGVLSSGLQRAGSRDPAFYSLGPPASSRLSRRQRQPREVRLTRVTETPLAFSFGEYAGRVDLY